LAVLAAVLLFASILTSAAYAEDSKQVGLVIRWSSGTEHTEIVTIPVDGSGLDALLAASVNVDSFDAGWGVSVCAIDGEGCSADDCFCDFEHFWGYWNLVDGAWASSVVGASAHIPAHGDVDGWSWTGFDDAFNPTVEPTLHSFEEIEAMQSPTDIPEPATLLLMGSGLAGLLALARSRRK
jgi:hypothetical protein